MEQTKTQIGQDFKNSEHADYKKMTLTIFAEYPLSLGKIIDTLKEKYGVEVDRIEKKEAKVTLNNV